MTDVWKAFVINQSETDYTIISERDKKYHTLPLPIHQGNIALFDGTVVDIQETVFGPHQLYMACKGYQYDILRKRCQYQKRVILKKETKKETIPISTISPFSTT